LNTELDTRTIVSRNSKSPGSCGHEESFSHKEFDIPSETSSNITLYTSVGDFKEGADRRRSETRTSSVDNSRVLRVCYPNNNSLLQSTDSIKFNLSFSSEWV